MLPKEMPKLPVEETVIVAPDIKLLQGGQIGDPTSQFSNRMSNGPGGPGGIGLDVAVAWDPRLGRAWRRWPPGIFPAGKAGVTVPQVIFNPEPSFSEEAPQSQDAGDGAAVVVVGKDGHTYDIRVGQSLGMGLDEKAIEAVNRWRFRPATLNGQPSRRRSPYRWISIFTEGAGGGVREQSDKRVLMVDWPRPLFPETSFS